MPKSSTRRLVTESSGTISVSSFHENSGFAHCRRMGTFTGSSNNLVEVTEEPILFPTQLYMLCPILAD